MRAKHAIISLLVLTVAAHAWAGTRDIVGLADAIDGDSLVVDGTEIRLFGIDAPEINQTCTTPAGTHWRCGLIAWRSLSDLIDAKAVICTPDGLDRYGRTLATCRVRGQPETLNATMVRIGLARAYTSFTQAYALQEQNARDERAGIWIGGHKAPWDWRREQAARKH